MLVDELRKQSVVYRALLPPGDARLTGVKYRHVSVFGPPESGKTTFALTVAANAEKAVEELGLSFLAIRALSLNDVAARMPWDKVDEPFYLYIFIDDAEASQSSMRQMSAEVVAAMRFNNTIRHQLALRGKKRGYAVLVYATQRFQNLQRLFRQGHVTVFKGLMASDPAEARYFEELLGEDDFEYLLQLTETIYMTHRDDVKAWYLARTIGGFQQWEKIADPAKPKNLVDLWSEDLLIAGDPVVARYGPLVAKATPLQLVAAARELADAVVEGGPVYNKLLYALGITNRDGTVRDILKAHEFLEAVEEKMKRLGVDVELVPRIRPPPPPEGEAETGAFIDDYEYR